MSKETDLQGSTARAGPQPQGINGLQDSEQLPAKNVVQWIWSAACNTTSHWSWHKSLPLARLIALDTTDCPWHKD